MKKIIMYYTVIQRKILYLNIVGDDALWERAIQIIVSSILDLPEREKYTYVPFIQT